MVAFFTPVTTSELVSYKPKQIPALITWAAFFPHMMIITDNSLFIGDCDFENHYCNWRNVPNNLDEFDWIRYYGRTGTHNTGPQFDHTKGTRQGNLILLSCYITISSLRKIFWAHQKLDYFYLSTSAFLMLLPDTSRLKFSILLRLLLIN